MRVQRKPVTSEFGLIKKGQIKIELYLGSLPPNSQLRKSHRSTSLQPTSLIRYDMVFINFFKLNKFLFIKL